MLIFWLSNAEKPLPLLTVTLMLSMLIPVAVASKANAGVAIVDAIIGGNASTFAVDVAAAAVAVVGAVVALSTGGIKYTICSVTLT